MKNFDDLWEDLGDLSEEDIYPVLTKLFTTYAAIYEKNPKDESARSFLVNLDSCISQANECNLNRR